jgi:hypothetical protein
MRVRVRVLTRGTRVKVRRPGPGERGVWTVTGRVRSSGIEDPAYDVAHERTGRVRVFRRSRLKFTRGWR